jgi:hypothetical protein
MAHRHLIDPHHIDDHPAAMFGLMIGTLAILTAVLVFSVYMRADDAGRRSFGSPAHVTTQQR